jgi:TRAP-type C4-dicarboxylate transport system substrate-binding protein
MKKMALFVLVVSIVLAVTVQPSISAPKHRWKFITITPAGQIYTKYYTQLADKITEYTNGEVKVTCHPAGELPYKGTDHLKVLNQGMVQMAEVVGGFVFGEAPLLVLPDFPYVYLDKKEMETYRKVVIPYVWEELRNRGVEPIAYSSYGPRQIVSRKPIKTLEDLKGQKVRTAGGLQEAYIKLWGGVPSFVVWAEVYPAAQRGIVDAIMTATLAIEQVKAYEVCPYFFKIDGPVGHLYVSVNRKSWNALSKKNQDAVLKAASEWQELWDRMVMHELDESALQRMLDKGQVKSVAKLDQEVRINTREKMLPILKDYVDKHMQPKGPEAFAKALKALGLQ